MVIHSIKIALFISAAKRKNSAKIAQMPGDFKRFAQLDAMDRWHNHLSCRYLRKTRQILTDSSPSEFALLEFFN
jgi:hypothetical protein